MLIGRRRFGLRRRLGPSPRLSLSLAFGLPLLLGSAPAAAAGSIGAFGGLTTWIGVLAALWTLLAPRQSAGSSGSAWLAGAATAVLVSGYWGWKRRRGRVGTALRKSAAVPLPWSGSPRVSMVGQASMPWPVGLDAKQVLEAARSRFIHLQAAWDDADVPALGTLTTPDMLEQLLPVLSVRGEGPNRTEVITLHAELLGVEEVGGGYLASVEFSGLIRESAERGAVPFRELWMLASASEGAQSWRLARQQTLY